MIYSKCGTQMHKCVLLIAAILSTFALSVSGIYAEGTTIFSIISEEIDGIGIENIILLISICIFYLKYWDKLKTIQHWTISLLAMCFAAFMLIGLSFSQNGNSDFIAGNKNQFCIAMIVFCGYFLLFKSILRLLYKFLDNLKPICTKGKTAGKSTRKIKRLIDDHFFLTSIIVIIVFWLPYLIVFFPGSVTTDGYSQLLQAYGIKTLTNAHGWMMTLVMGAIMRIGQHVNDNFGIFLIVCILYVFEAICYALACKIIHRWKLPFGIKVGFVFFFGLFPIFGSYAQAIIKDSPFMSMFVLYMTIYIDMCLVGTNRIEVENKKKSLILHVTALLVSGFIMCTIRNNGAYLVLISALFLIALLGKGFRRYAITFLICMYSLIWIHSNILTPMAGVTSVTGRAKLYMSFQVVGRYLSEYSSDLTEDEQDVLSRVFKGYDDLSEIGEAYNPDICDPVKSYYNNKSTSEDLKDYAGVVVSMFLKHPRTCIEAVLNQSFGYYYPFYNTKISLTFQFYIKGNLAKSYNTFDIDYIMPDDMRNFLSTYTNMWKKLPGLSQLINPATPTWILMFFAGYLAYRRKWREILMLGAPSLNMVICMLSPVNGLLRYAMPSTACLPIVIYWCILVTSKEKTLVDEENLQTEEIAESRDDNIIFSVDIAENEDDDDIFFE